MPVWRPAASSRRALDALARFAAPSVPSPVPGSIRVGPYTWLHSSPPEQLIAEYRLPTAPIPPDAVVEDGPDSSLLVRSPHRVSGVYVAPAPHGSRYTIIPGPTVVLNGPSSTRPAGRFWARTYPLMTLDLGNIPVMQCELTWRGKPWHLVIADVTEPDTQAKRAAMRLKRGSLVDGNRMDEAQPLPAPGSVDASVWTAGDVTLAPDGSAQGEFGPERRRISLRWHLTDSVSELLQALNIHMQLNPGSVTLAHDRGLPKRRLTVIAEGFPPGSRLEFAFDGSKLRGADTNSDGSVRVQLRIPLETPPGRHTVTVTGEGDRAFELPYTVLSQGKR